MLFDHVNLLNIRILLSS